MAVISLPARPSIGRLSFLPPGPPRQHHGAGRHVAGSDLEPERNPPPFPLIVLGARLHSLPRSR